MLCKGMQTILWTWSHFQKSLIRRVEFLRVCSVYWASYVSVKYKYYLVLIPFLTCVSHTAHVIARLDVCLSVCLSVTRWYCVKTALPIVKLSSLPGSPMILVFWGLNFFPEFQWKQPNIKCKGGRKKLQFPTNISIARKWLKIDGYMLPCVWPALNPLSTHVIFTGIVPWAYPGEAKMCKKCAKMVNFWTYGLKYWETVEDRWIHAAMHLTSIESSFHPCNITAIVAWVYPEEAKMCRNWRTFRWR